MIVVNYLKKNSSILTIILTLFSVGTGYGSDKLSSLEFLNRVRHPAGRKTWSMLSGHISHLRRGTKTQSVPIYLGILFSSNRTLAQIVVNKSQAYMVGQQYSTENSSTTVIPQNKIGYKKSLLAEFGIKPEDLTMSFIYWKLLRELDETSIKTLNCRVFALISHDKSEFVHLYISSTYFFPMKVEWFKAKTTKPYRTLQVTDFTQKNKIWLVSRIKFYGPGWRSIVDFNKIKAGLSQNNIPPELFKQLPTSK